MRNPAITAMTPTTEEKLFGTIAASTARAASPRPNTTAMARSTIFRMGMPSSVVIAGAGVDRVHTDHTPPVRRGQAVWTGGQDDGTRRTDMTNTTTWRLHYGHAREPLLCVVADAKYTTMWRIRFADG